MERRFYDAEQYRRAFTLVELAVVLVIIGLLVGGVLVGRELVTQAEMRSTMKQLEQYQAAVRTFQGKYRGLPGDFAKATTYFTADATCRAYGATSASLRNYMAASNGQTCNGDGDGNVKGPGGAYAEPFLFWQHLALAGLIPGEYTGTCAWSGCDDTGSGTGLTYVANLNVPTVPYRSMLVTIRNPYMAGESAQFYSGPGHIFWLGAALTADPAGVMEWNYWADYALTADEVSAFDIKYDDGYPTTGLMTPGRIVPAGNCVTGATPPLYVTGNALKRCSLMFKAGF